MENQVIAATRQKASFSLMSADSANIVEHAPIEQLKDAVPGGVNVSMEYLDFEQGVPIRAVYLGTTMHTAVNKETGEETPLPAVVLLDETRTFKVNAAVKLCAALERLPSETPVQITWTKTKKTQNGGQMRLFDVRILNLQ